jgi:hypothetical protein
LPDLVRALIGSCTGPGRNSAQGKLSGKDDSEGYGTDQGRVSHSATTPKEHDLWFDARILVESTALTSSCSSFVHVVFAEVLQACHLASLVVNCPLPRCMSFGARIIARRTRLQAVSLGQGKHAPPTARPLLGCIAPDPPVSRAVRCRPEFRRQNSNMSGYCAPPPYYVDPAAFDTPISAIGRHPQARCTRKSILGPYGVETCHIQENICAFAVLFDRSGT